jgi:hypothetical protein
MKLYRYNLIEIVWQKGQQSQSAAARMFYFLNQLEKIPRNAMDSCGCGIAVLLLPTAPAGTTGSVSQLDYESDATI